MEQLEGIIEEIIFHNEDNGYTVCDIKQGKATTTVVGYLPSVNVGEYLAVTGSWQNHPSYGQQLKVEYFEKKIPTDLQALEKYLGSGIIKGVGIATSKKIIKKFGEDTLNIIRTQTQRLTEIKGINKAKAELISNTILSQEELRGIMTYLMKYGVSSTYAIKAYKKFGSSTKKEIENNPYRLTDDEIGIGFKTADRIAQAIGIERNSKFRLQCGIKYILNKAILEGNVFLPKDILEKKADSLLGTD